MQRFLKTITLGSAFLHVNIKDARLAVNSTKLTREGEMAPNKGFETSDG